MIHYLMLVHKDFNQAQLLINKLKTINSRIYVHVDWKVKYFPEFKDAELINNRVKTNWWWFSQIKTELNWVREVYGNMKEWDHIVIISWQCRPIKGMDYIEKYINGLWDESCLNYVKIDDLTITKVDRYYFNDIDFHMSHLNKWLYNLIENMWHSLWGSKIPVTNMILHKIVSFILPKRKYLLNNYKLYKWGNWITMSYKHTKRAIEFLDSEKWKKFLNAFKYTNCADEIFFQTLLYNSPMKSEVRNETLWYTKRPENSSSPYTITEEFYDELIKSDKLFARKFDINVDWKIVEKLEKLEKHLLNK